MTKPGKVTKRELLMALRDVHNDQIAMAELMAEQAAKVANLESAILSLTMAMMATEARRVAMASTKEVGEA
jgi:hypothetical protein